MTGSTSFDNSQNYLTDVGAYTSATSPYGTFDQGGNVWEWNEALISGSFPGLRGGSWSSGSNNLRASVRFSVSPSDADLNVGFRVASIPEPTTMCLVLCHS